MVPPGSALECYLCLGIAGLSECLDPLGEQLGSDPHMLDVRWPSKAHLFQVMRNRKLAVANDCSNDLQGTSGIIIVTTSGLAIHVLPGRHQLATDGRSRHTAGLRLRGFVY